MTQVIDLRAISNAIALKLIADPAFKAQFIKDPAGVLRAEGVPEDRIPGTVNVDVHSLDKALKQAQEASYRISDDPVLKDVLCVVI